MKKIFALMILSGVLITGCEKDDTTVTPTTPTSNVFTSGNVKTKAVYFSFAAKDSVASTAAWDMKLTTLYAPDDSLRQFPFPGIALNPSGVVAGTIVDGTPCASVDPSTVTGLKKDIVDTVKIDSTRSIKGTPLYYSFARRETTTVTGDWDVKLTINASAEPLIVLNKIKGVLGKVLDNTDYATLNAATVTGLEADVNDTTLVIGNKCFLYAGPPTHKLNPVTNRTFIIRSSNGARIKAKMLNYYNAAGTSGYFKFEYSAPEAYSLGTSILKYAGPPTHKLDPITDRTFVVNTSAGAKAKFKMLTYYNAAGASGYMKFEYEVK
jgi:hypothetical protein